GDTDDADFRPSPNFLQAPDVKFALNAVQSREGWQQARRTPRASATSMARAPFPLDIAWQYPDRNYAPDPGAPTVPVEIGAVVSTAVHNRDILYAVSLPTVDDAPAYLMAFDMTPEADRDGDGMPDDGPADYSLGAPYDMLWYQELPEMATPRYSSPTIAAVPDYPQLVLVSYVNAADGTGWVACVDGTVGGDGAQLWLREIEGYSDAAMVTALSTPVVHNGYVYVLASEFDPTLTGSDVNQTYGRVHCFELDYEWTDADAWPTDAYWWVYPANENDIDGIGAPGAPPGGPAVEEQRSLPPFHDPEWVADPARPPLPPAPGATPVVHAAASGVDNLGVDALVTFGTPISYRWNGSDVRNFSGNDAGGSQYTVAPAPYNIDDDDYGLNADYFTLQLNEPITAYTSTETLDGAEDVDQETWDPDGRYLRFSPASAREAAIYAVDNGANPLEAQRGVDVDVTYTNADGDEVTEGHRLPGTVRWKRTLEPGQQINQPASMGADELAVSASRPIDNTEMTNPGGSSSIMNLDPASGATQWSYDPSRGMPGRSVDAQGQSATAAAFDDETVVVGASAVDYALGGGDQAVVSSVLGLNRQIDAEVDLWLGDDGEHPEAVYMLWGGVENEIAPSSYSVDARNGRLIFPAESAADVRYADDGTRSGLPIYGKAIRVEWADDGSGDPFIEDHIVPHIERFHHTPGYIRLQHRPYDAGSVTITRPDGTVINDADSVTPSEPFGWPDDERNAILDGWIDMTLAVDADGNDVLPGDEVLVSYTGWSEELGEWIDIPNADANIAVERHQIAVEFGPSVSSPSVAGNTIHLGTQGRDADLDGTFEGATDRGTLLSLMWDKASGFVRSGLMQPARAHDPAYEDDVPVVTGAPSIAEDRVFVGSRLMSDDPDPIDYDTVGPGYVSALAPWRVLLCDTDRIVETTGSQPSWVCTGTSSPQRAQSFIGEDLQRPFNRPAKATRLETDHILVVDSGNHRVVEIDRAGRVVWPLDMFGYEYYTSPDNNDLKLSRPADAHRYYEVDDDGYPVWHTVIADTGNARVIEIQTTFHNEDTGVVDGRQRHDVRVLTPTYIRGPEGATRVRYTSATPIRDPRNDTLVGYLCAASNLHQLLVVTASEDNRLVNPFATVAVDTDGATSGSTWEHWAWLYDADPADGDDVSDEPLQFENIKHVDVQRIGGMVHVAVTCGRYIGRSGEDTHDLAEEGAGVFEFRIDVNSDDPADWELADLSAGGESDDPHWRFTALDYRGRDMTTISTDADDYNKRWYPVSSQRITDDRVLITNSLSQIEDATFANIGDRTAVLGSHIFEVTTEPGGGHSLDPDRSVPAPGEMWVDPFAQPAHAEISR
ncbi:MAG: hypothetical protein ACOC7J_00060, partial [Armatimonadota bacterium]